MRWSVVLIVGYLMMGLELGVRSALRLDQGGGGVAPSFVLPFVVFIALSAPTTAALWTGLIAGLVIDLTTLHPDAGAIVPGPTALGCTLCAYFVVTVRGMVIRRNPLTLVFLSIVGSALTHIIVVSLLSMRNVMYGDQIGFHPGTELLERMLSSVYTGATALVLCLVLFPMLPMFGFIDPHHRRPLMGGAARRY